jgi:hypothetical protein
VFLRQINCSFVLDRGAADLPNSEIAESENIGEPALMNRSETSILSQLTCGTDGALYGAGEGQQLCVANRLIDRQFATAADFLDSG